MHDEQQLRESVSKAYAKAVSAPSCAADSCCTPVPKGVAAKLAGYTSDELAALPADAVANSFGCGNPLAFSEVRQGEVVLDLGSGAGIDILLAAKKVGATGRAIGIDMTDDMIDRARENIQVAGVTNAEVRKGIIEDLPVDSNSIDWVISNCVINLSPEKNRVFAEIARVLKPGGRMLISDIVAAGLPAWILDNEALYSLCIAGAISEEAYLEGLRKAGLTDVEVRERIHYSGSQIETLMRSELPGNATVVGDCQSSGVGSISDGVQSLERKIWSAKFFGRKPSN